MIYRRCRPGESGTDDAGLRNIGLIPALRFLHMGKAANALGQATELAALTCSFEL